MSVLRLHNISHRFGQLPVLQPISLDLGPGARHALTGANGAGKSTLLAIIDGTLTPSTGDVFLFGQRITSLPVHRRARMGVGRVFQTPQLCGRHTARANIQLALAARAAQAVGTRRLDLWPSRPINAVADTVLERSGLLSLADQPAAHLSHGQRRQLEIAIAIAAQPVLLLLDEPTAGLSTHGSDTITNLLAGLPETTAMIVVEHDQDALRRLTTTGTHLQPPHAPTDATS